MKLTKFEVELLIEDLKQGRIMPIKIEGYRKPEQLFLSYDKKGFHTFGELTGLVDITENNIYLNFLENGYSIGYSRALDMTNTEVKEGDFIVLPFNNETGIVRKLIIEPETLMEKCTESTAYKSFYKYDHILKPIAVIEITHQIEKGEYTNVPELQHVKPKSITREIRTDRLITKNTRVYFNVKMHK